MGSLFTLVVFALVNVYRDYQREQEEALEHDVVMGIRRWREEKRSKVRNKAIVFVGERYGIIWGTGKRYSQGSGDTGRDLPSV